MKRSDKYNNPNYNLCKNEYVLDCNTESLNGPRLVGGPNPKTLIAPIVHPRITDLEHWRRNPNINHSSTNSSGSYDSRMSGYIPQRICAESDNSCLVCIGSVCNCNCNQQYTTHNVIEPIQSNLGISCTTTFPSNRFYLSEHSKIKGCTTANVYDPRFYGSGDNNRVYEHKITNQPRFNYSDIDNIRMNKYINRNNIDVFINQPSDCENIRPLVQNTYIDKTSEHRTFLQNRLMRKRNAELVEMRKHPVHKNFKLSLKC